MTEQTNTPTPRERRIPLRVAPNDGLPDWPHGTSADPAAEKVRRLAVRLAEVMAERGLSARAVARLAGIGVGTVQVIQHGDRWPDTRAVARLEVALDTALWPGTSTEPDARAGNPSVMATMIANGPDTPVATN